MLKEGKGLIGLSAARGVRIFGKIRRNVWNSATPSRPLNDADRIDLRIYWFHSCFCRSEHPQLFRQLALTTPRPDNCAQAAALSQGAPDVGTRVFIIVCFAKSSASPSDACLKGRFASAMPRSCNAMVLSRLVVSQPLFVSQSPAHRPVTLVWNVVLHQPCHGGPAMTWFSVDWWYPSERPHTFEGFLPGRGHRQPPKSNFLATQSSPP